MRETTEFQPVRARASLRGMVTQEMILAAILLIIVAILSLTSDQFLTARNLFNVARFFVETGLIALPMTLIIITGGIDLSVGSILGWSAIMLGYSWQVWGFPLPVAIGIALLTGLVAGFFNGWLIAYIKVPPLIATLATLAIYRGLAYGISQGRPVSGFPDWFEFFGQGNIGPFPTQLIPLVVFAVVVIVFLARMPWGRFIHAIGYNEEASRFSALPVNHLLLSIYTFSGLMSALAAIIYVSRVTTTRPDAGVGLELDVIAAVVLGGTSIYGGEGTVVGTILGLIVIAVLRNGLSLAGVQAEATVVIIGAVLIGAVYLNRKLRGVKGGAR